jgi:hypothetical protein
MEWNNASSHLRINHIYNPVVFGRRAIGVAGGGRQRRREKAAGIII